MYLPSGQIVACTLPVYCCQSLLNLSFPTNKSIHLSDWNNLCSGTQGGRERICQVDRLPHVPTPFIAVNIFLIQPISVQEHKVGENVFAKWTDCRMYPARVLAVNPNGTYEVLFYDGFQKVVQPINVKPIPPDVQAEVRNEHGFMLLFTGQNSHYPPGNHHAIHL